MFPSCGGTSEKPFPRNGPVLSCAPARAESRLKRSSYYTRALVACGAQTRVSEYTETVTSELAVRLFRRLTTSPGVIDTQRLFRTYARLTEVITHPLLHDLLARYF